jgi:IS30 family transposase
MKIGHQIYAFQERRRSTERDVAALLGRNPATIGRELPPCRGERDYRPKQAQQMCTRVVPNPVESRSSELQSRRPPLACAGDLLPFLRSPSRVERVTGRLPCAKAAREMEEIGYVIF